MAYSRDKLTKYKLMKSTPELKATLPKTYSFSSQHFQTLLQQYGKVIVKPSSGYGGAGVISVSTKDHKTYKIHHGTTVSNIRGIQPATAYVKRKITGSAHIVQKKIELAKVKGRPFDIRVMVQKKKRSDWSVTGKLAKIAGSGYFITNVARSRGRVVPLSEAIQQSNIRGKSTAAIQNNINRIALKAVKKLNAYYRIHTVGLDVGLDPKGKVWIIEPNFKPNVSLFLKLKDKSMYRKIKSYSP